MADGFDKLRKDITAAQGLGISLVKMADAAGVSDRTLHRFVASKNQIREGTFKAVRAAVDRLLKADALEVKRMRKRLEKVQQPEAAQV